MSHVSTKITELPRANGKYIPEGRAIISEVRIGCPTGELQSVAKPELNTATNDLVKSVSLSKPDIFLILSEKGRMATGERGNGEIGIYVFDEYRDASIIWHNDVGEQRIDLDQDDIKQHFGSLAGIFENPLNALKVVNPKIKL